MFRNFWVTAMIHLISGISGNREADRMDLTMKPNETGCDVAKATIELINHYHKTDKQNGGLLLPHDHNFLLYRIAYMYDFGQNLSLLPANGFGMWGMTMEHFTAARKWPDSLLLNRAVKPKNFYKLADEELFKPRIGALTAFLLIQRRQENVPALSDIEGQWSYWVEISGLNDTNGDMRRRFLERSQALMTGLDSDVSQCMKCSQPPSDIVFIFDDSHSIHQGGGLEIQISFIRTVLEYLKSSFDSENSQAAIVIFAANLTNSTPYMNDYNLAVGFTNSIVNLSGYINNQPWGTNLVAGLREAVNIISNDPRSRRDDNSVRKLVFLLTDGQGTAAHEHAKYPEFTERLKNVQWMEKENGDLFLAFPMRLFILDLIPLMSLKDWSL